MFKEILFNGLNLERNQQIVHMNFGFEITSLLPSPFINVPLLLHNTLSIWLGVQLTQPISCKRCAVYIVQDLQFVSVLGRDKGYTVKYNPLPEGVPEGKARGNS